MTKTLTLLFPLLSVKIQDIYSFSAKTTPSWQELSNSLPELSSQKTKKIDSVLDPSTPKFSTQVPTLFRERHGWCPYSERVWLALEYLGREYDEILIDNTGHGPRPSYYYGTTPQMKFEDGKNMGESMDLVEVLDRENLLYNKPDVNEKINSFRQIFPRNARPSSRAAFLFSSYDGPLSKSVFERVLSDTNDLLSETKGSFLCGEEFSAADVAWCPFLERYQYQLPCFYDGLNPRDSDRYPFLAQWYDAMENEIPEYLCRVKGNPSSWRKVLVMAGYGNAGDVPADVMNRMQYIQNQEWESYNDVTKDLVTENEQNLWGKYIATRPYLAPTPSQEAAKIILSKNEAIINDIERQMKFKKEWKQKLSGMNLDQTLRALVDCLIIGEFEESSSTSVSILASFLDDRMCVPRDMSELSALSIKRIAAKCMV